MKNKKSLTKKLPKAQRAGQIVPNMTARDSAAVRAGLGIPLPNDGYAGITQGEYYRMGKKIRDMYTSAKDKNEAFSKLKNMGRLNVAINERLNNKKEYKKGGTIKKKKK